MAGPLCHLSIQMHCSPSSHMHVCVRQAAADKLSQYAIAVAGHGCRRYAPCDVLCSHHGAAAFVMADLPRLIPMARSDQPLRAACMPAVCLQAPGFCQKTVHVVVCFVAWTACQPCSPCIGLAAVVLSLSRSHRPSVHGHVPCCSHGVESRMWTLPAARISADVNAGAVSHLLVRLHGGLTVGVRDLARRHRLVHRRGGNMRGWRGGRSREDDWRLPARQASRLCQRSTMCALCSQL